MGGLALTAQRGLMGYNALKQRAPHVLHGLTQTVPVHGDCPIFTVTLKLLLCTLHGSKPYRDLKALLHVQLARRDTHPKKPTFVPL